MKVNKIKLYSIMFTLLLILYSNNAMATIDVNRLATSNYKVQNHLYNANDGNDIFVNPHQELSLISEEARIKNSNANLRQFVQTNQFNWGTQTTDQTHSLPLPGILGYTNTTNPQIMLEYEAEYYDLLNIRSIDATDNSSKSFSSLLLYTGRTYGFKVHAEEVGPMYLSFFLSEVNFGTALTMTVQMQSPSGIQNTFFQGMTRQTMTYIPFMAYETGNYTFFISPSRDGVFTQISLNENPNINEISNGVSEHLRSGDSVIKFYRMPIPNGIPTLTDLRSFVFQSRYLGGLPYLGTIALRVFPSSPQITSQFGISLPRQLVSSDFFIISVVAIPPDESDPSIEKAKENVDLPSGIDIEYSITSEFYPLPQLPINEDFVTNTQNPATSASQQQFYFFNVTKTMLLGLNSSSPFFNSATFIPMDMNGTQTTMDADINDILNNRNHSPVFLPPGEYYVVFAQNIGFRISSYDTSNLEKVDPGSLEGTMVSTRLDQPEFFFLDSDNVHLDYLNVTYLDQNNQSITLEFSFYLPDGTLLFSTTQDFEHYYDVTSTLQVTNNSVVIPAFFNVNGLYMRVNQLGNTIYNGTGFITDTNSNEITSNFLVSPMYQSEVTEMVNPNAVIDTASLTDQIILELNAINSTIQGLYMIEAEANHAYRLTIDSLNRSLNSIALVNEGPTFWVNTFGIPPSTIDNETHYIFEYNFATSIDQRFGLFIIFGTQNLNGTMSITLEELEVHQIPGLVLSLINANGFRETKLAAIDQPLITAAVTLGLVGIAVAVILLRRGAMI